MELSNQSLENLFSFENGLYTVGTLLLAFSIMYFEQNSVFGLSPVIKAFSLILVFKLLFVGGLKARSRFLQLGLLGSASFAYILFLSYTSSYLGRASIYTLMLLGASAVGFMVLGKLHENGFELKNKNLALLVLAVFLVAIIGVDITGSKTRHSFNLDSEVTIKQGEVELGSIVFQNEFFLPREPEDVELKACYMTENGVEERHVNVDMPRLIGGGGVSTAQLSFYYRTDSENDIGQAFNITRVESCDDISENVIGVIESEERFYSY